MRAVVAFAMLLAATPALAQQMCGPADKVLQALEKRYQERAVFEGEIEWRVRLVEADPEREGIALVLLQKPAALAGDKGPGHVAFVAAEGQLLRIEPDARRIFEWLPAGLYPGLGEFLFPSG